MKIQDQRSDLKRLCAFSVALFVMLPVANSAEVVLTSDPPGAVISIASKEAGVTPLTLDLPTGQPVEITSRFGPLALLVHTLTPDENQVIAYQFKHEYGTIVVTCDRTDAALVIDGTGYGHPPAVVLVSPGNHKLFTTAANAPDKTREVEVAAGQRVSVELDFSGGSPETTKTNLRPQASPQPSLSAVVQPTPSPKGYGPKPPQAERTRVEWEEPPPLIPPAVQPADPSPSAELAPRRKPVSKPVKTGKKRSTSVAMLSTASNTETARPASSPLASVTLDKGKARAAINEMWQAREQELKAKKATIENKIENSTGSVREQWKYRLAVLRQKMADAKSEETAAEAALK